MPSLDLNIDIDLMVEAVRSHKVRGIRCGCSETEALDVLGQPDLEGWPSRKRLVYLRKWEGVGVREWEGAGRKEAVEIAAKNRVVSGIFLLPKQVLFAELEQALGGLVMTAVPTLTFGGQQRGCVVDQKVSIVTDLENSAYECVYNVIISE